MRGALWGSDAVSADTLLRAYALHVAALPIPGALLLAYHMWRIRKAGGLARPAQTEAAPLIPTRPALTVRELGIALGATALLVALALVWDAPLGPPGDPPRPIDPAKAPWFFLWVQELVSYSTLLGGAAPIVLLGLLALAPLGERRADLAGSWLARPRLGRCLAFVAIALAIAGLTAVAAFLRGPGWRFTGR
jgi:quinol-cytochrome oxidoreductase complex cytochrome b subunit